MAGRTYSVAAAAKSLQSCPTLRDPIDGSPPGSPVNLQFCPANGEKIGRKDYYGNNKKMSRTNKDESSWNLV